MALKRVGVIGSVNRDTIVGDDGTLTQSYGGVLYTALALAYLGRRRVEAWLFGKIGEDVWHEGGGCHGVYDGVTMISIISGRPCRTAAGNAGQAAITR